MSHDHSKNYAAKHSPGTQIDARVAEAVRQRSDSGKITCAEAHKIAQELQVSPADVGMTSDLSEIRISQCQLGLFGYGAHNRLVQPAERVAPELQQAIAAAQTDKRLACLAAWELAARFGMSRVEIASACEALQIKISACQLGAFA